MGNDEENAEMEKLTEGDLLNWVIERGCSFSTGIITYYNKRSIRTICTYKARASAKDVLRKIIARENAPKKEPNPWGQKK